MKILITILIVTCFVISGQENAQKNNFNSIKNNKITSGEVHTDSTNKNMFTPLEIVQQQIEAYNSHDLDAFADTHSDSIEAYIFPEKPLGKGKKEQRRVFEEFFAKAPEVHAQIKSSISFGEYVINHEVATGMPEGEKTEAIVIYKVENNLITKVWYIYK